MININSSSILIVNNIDETLNSLIPSFPSHSYRIVRNEEKDDFLTAQAQQVIKEAYISSNETKYIVLCGNSFRVEAQNSLLKVLEEPPRNIVFVIITTSKSNILPTILSRMPHKYLKSKIDRVDIDFDFFRMDLKSLYQFLKDNQKIGKKEAKAIIESVMIKINLQKIKLTQKELDVFSNGIKLLELNSRPINILTTLLLTIIHRKHR
ncbi:DNA polymerase III subunit delta' [Arcobacter sp. F2176]|uniref:DNA polymerase III subunit delta' n=1 Tax=unclassified Arcobacter TaxID=2593671 RepID=UPI00100BFD40|nr:DNA polymerase III subunit delta' [Arcobacter sp. F2176]RXJ82671.1 DNA polymerase III subunit delta' [Arcobacter sp. F2176]